MLLFILQYLINDSLFNPVNASCLFQIPPENIRKSMDFLFSGGIERDQWQEIG